MKLNLQCGNRLLNGYLNIHNSIIQIPSNLDANVKFIIGNFDNLDPILNGEQAEEIIFSLPLNTISPNQMAPTLQYWKTKLIKNGLLKINFVDIRRIGKLAHTGELDLMTLHNYIYGPEYQMKTLIDTLAIKELVKQLGFFIEMISQQEILTIVELKNVSN